MTEKKLITAEELRKLIHYNPETGIFVWLTRMLRPGLERIDKGWNTRLAKKTIAPRLDKKGYSQICIAPFSNQFAHRLAWLYVYGTWPNGEIDHINGNPIDNRIENLREATHQQNMCNQKIRSDNTSGVKGVSHTKRGKPWRAQININGKVVYLGNFSTKEEAIECRKRAENRTHGTFSRAI